MEIEWSKMIASSSPDQNYPQGSPANDILTSAFTSLWHYYFLSSESVEVGAIDLGAICPALSCSAIVIQYFQPLVMQTENS